MKKLLSSLILLISFNAKPMSNYLSQLDSELQKTNQALQASVQKLPFGKIPPSIAGLPLFQGIPTPGGGLNLQLDQNISLSLTAEKRNALIAELVANPQRILNQNNNTMHGMKTIDPDTFYAQSQQISPFWLLNECVEESCRLNRLKHPMYRQLFENNVLEFIKQRYPNKEKRLVCASLGSGALFQELVMLTKLLEDGYTEIEINLIDKSYDEYISFLKEKRYVVLDNIFDSSHNQRGYWLRALSYRFAQLLFWLAQYKDRSITLNIYPHIDAYQQDCENNTSLQPDVLVATDFLDDYSANEQTFIDLFLTGACKLLKNSGLFFYSHERGEPFRFYTTKETRKKIDDIKDFKLSDYFEELTPFSCTVASYALPIWYDENLTYKVVTGASFTIALYIFGKMITSKL